MCDFFSVTSNGNGQIKYFDHDLRKKILDGELDVCADSHTSINEHFGFKGLREDWRNKYEYNPLTDTFKVDHIGGKNDQALVARKVRALDFKTIIPELNVIKMINPLKLSVTIEIKEAVALLKKFNKTNDELLEKDIHTEDVYMRTLEELVGRRVALVTSYASNECIWGELRRFCRDKIGIESSFYIKYLRTIVWAYFTSFFTIDKWKEVEHKKGENPFQALITLFNAGYFPIYDKDKYRLYTKDGLVWTSK